VHALAVDQALEVAVFDLDGGSIGQLLHRGGATGEQFEDGATGRVTE
jgi:hypothetical protein